MPGHKSAMQCRSEHSAPSVVFECWQRHVVTFQPSQPGWHVDSCDCCLMTWFHGKNWAG